MAVKLNKADLEFILTQIKIAEAHAAGADLTDLIPDPHLPWGLRTVDGTYNNLVAGRETWGAADTLMPRMLDGSFIDEEDGEEFSFGPAGPGVPPPVTNTNYAADGSVVDSDPRIISNLIVDMSIGNPAAVQAFLNNELAVATFEEKHGKEPVAPGAAFNPATQMEVTNEDLALIPNIAPDEGISAPFNSWMTFFGQFFDHGLDLITKGSNGTVYIPLQPDDPLYVEGGHTNFMVMTRATPIEHLPGADGELGTADDVVNHKNTTTPFVDQNQTYTSHASHQVFLREYELNIDGEPVATGHLLDGQDGGLATWGQIKAQAATMLGIQLTDGDVLNIPLLRTDPYGEFIRGENGLPLIVLRPGADGIPNTDDDIVKEGDLANPVNTFTVSVDVGGTTHTGAARIGHAFLDDIAHNAVPVFDTGGNLVKDADTETGNAIAADPRGNKVAYDDELLDRHYITGDGRGNENIALTAVHHIFHSEHNRLVDSNKVEILQSGDLDFINEWLVSDLTSTDDIPAGDGLALLAYAETLNWDGERLFQAARFGTEMEYQHLVFEEFARKIQPAIDPFIFNPSTDIDPSIFAEFANVVYRFGHSMLTETVARTNIHDGSSEDIGLIEAFLNPVEFTQNGAISADEAAASIVLGMTSEHGNAIDEFVTSVLRNNLLGLPLDLAAINIARGRDTGMPTLNEAREQLYAATASSFLKPYDSWSEFAQNLKNPMSVVNFIAAYGVHPLIEAAGDGLEARRDAAMMLVFGDASFTPQQNADRIAFLNSTGIYDAESVGLNAIDLWIGGLAEQILLFGGMLGSTFSAIFEAQLESLQDGDRFYYLSRTQGQNFLIELENNAFSKLILANTDLSDPGPDGIRGTGDDIIKHHIGVDAFGQYDYVLEVNKANQLIDDPVGTNPVLEALGVGKVVRDDPRTPDVDESAVTGFVASINAMVQKYDANGVPTGALIDGTEDVLGGITVGDIRANVADLGFILSDQDLLDAPVLRLKADGSLAFTPNPAATTSVNLLSDDFEAASLATGESGVIPDANGNYTITAPAGWEIVGGAGGLYDPAATITDQTGPSGTNVVWLRQGATLAMSTGESIVAGQAYTLSFDVGDRTNQPWPGGTARIVATDGVNSQILASEVLPSPGEGGWANVTIETPALDALYADLELRIEIQQNPLGGGNQILVDTISLTATTAVVYSSDLTPTDMGAAYDPAADPFARDQDGNVIRSGQGIVDLIPAATDSSTIVVDPQALAEAYTPGSYLKFTGGEHVVLGGTSGNDTLIGSFGDDGIWGDAGDDFIEGGQGVDLILGGAGNDIILDSGDSGNFIKGEDGDDVIANSAGPFDILMGGRGQDVVFVGPDDTEVFGGDGNDFIAGGEGVDFLLGNEGDDWIEGAGGFDTLAGDNSELFFDSAILGHDVLFAGNDESDFDAESGDDIMVQGESVMRNEGMFGFDWVSFQGNSLDAYADMRIRIFTTEAEDILRNRFDKVEGLSGWDNNDQLFGDDRVAPDVGDDGVGGDTIGANENVLFNDGLSQAGVDRIHNLREFLGDLIAARPQGLTANELEEIIAFDQGNILLGGRGTDRISGNGGNDIIDGDRWLNVRISITDPVNGSELATVTTLRHVFTAADRTAADEPVPTEWVGRSLFELLVDREITPSQMSIVREILDDPTDGGFDTAVFRGNIAEYNIEGAGFNGNGFFDVDGDGFVTVTHLDPVAADGVTLGIDGIDWLSNIERLEFLDAVVNQVPGSNGLPTGTIAISNPRPAIGETLSITLLDLVDPDNETPTNLTGAVSASDLTVTWQAEDAFQSGEFVDIGTGATLTVTAAMLGLQIRAIARFRDGDGVLETVQSGPTEIVANNVTPVGTAAADVLIGRNGADTINGLGGDDEIFGLGGADRLIGGAGNDIIDGGRGNDTAVFSGNSAAFTFEFDELGNMEVVETATGEEDLVLNIENFEFDNETLTLAQAQSLAGIIGTDAADILPGTAADDFIFGRGGADMIDGLGGDDFLFGEGGGDILNGGAGVDTLSGGNGADTLNGDGGADVLNGDAGNDILNGGNGADTLSGGAGDDTVNGDVGNDTIVWNAGDGRDVINGGANGALGDTFVINGDISTENFDIYAAGSAELDALGYAGGAEIVITRNGLIIAELTDIEEIVINTGGGGGIITPHGDFAPTSLSTNTITINGTAGDDVVDIAALQSAHRILFRSNGGSDTIVGTLRPQDVIELPAGSTLAAYTTSQSNGMTTMSNGTHAVSFPSSGTPSFRTAGENDDDGITGDFELTARDIAGLKNLVNGQQAFEDDDDTEGATGIRELIGRNNNEDHPEYGSADETFIRLTQARYGEFDASINNNKINPIFDGLDARTISNILGTQEEGLPKSGADANTFFMAFGQYFDHGLDFIPKDSAYGVIQIGGEGSARAPGTDNPADLTRAAVHEIDENGVPQHLNKASPFVDQNQAYGSNELVGQFLRESDGDQGFGMKLLAGAADPSNPDFNLLPTLRELIQHHWQNDTIFVDPSLPGGQMSFRDYYSDYPIGENATGDVFDEATGAYDPDVVAAMASNFMGGGYPLLLDTNPYINLLDHYVAGDGRANENYALTAMHTIWARNHNFHVDKLIDAGFEGTEEEVFQAAKMINEAEYQRVVFTEFADMLIGGIQGDGDHGHSGYNPGADARISQEFASAVYRVGHSLVGQTMTVIDENGQPKEVALFDAFLNPTNAASAFTAPLPPGYVPQPGYGQIGVGSILGGITMQAAEEVDFNIVDAIRNDLVRINADLFAFNVARGWDVGLGTLNQVRADLQASADPYIQEALGFAGALDPYASWEDFQARNGLSDTIVDQMKQAYPDLVLSTPEEIAAFVAVNPDIALIDGPDGTKIVKGIDRVDLWVGGLAEKHINGGMVGQTFWVVLHEQFDRLQEGDRFYYLDRFDNFDFYESFVDGQEFADIIARNTGLTGLPEHIFEVNDEDGADSDDDDDSDSDDDTTGVGNSDDDDDDEDDDDDTTAEDSSGDDSSDGDDADAEDGTDDDDDASQSDDSDDGDDDGSDDDEAGDPDQSSPPPATTVASLVLAGSAAVDVLAGGGGDDILLGLEGDDVLVGDMGADTLRGDAGNDLVKGGGGDDIVFGGTGDDQLFGESGHDMLFGDAGNDHIFGGGDDDFIEAGSGNDEVFAGAGDDTVVATSNDGNDVYFGEGGNDTLDYAAITASLSVDLGSGVLGQGSVVSTETGSDTIYGFENFIGGTGNDTIVAGMAVNVMDGGTGDDTFVFNSVGAANGDVIFGFQPGDKIDLSGIDAVAGTAGNQDFTLAGTAFSGAGQVIVKHEAREDGMHTLIQGNVGGGTDPDFTIDIRGQHDLTASDFAGVS